ncbi:SURF1 family protein [Pelagibius litoralis]|uniref:SURF1-like protein n=1 Tax=Pelagibius litoralis TaxID=374515 RepID=A0A967F3A2_9PROT|nr:SURF1 family protein [Pelagibius litoralis]NIA72199.1 SURF1 family protein [Pelagibius litoralis]
MSAPESHGIARGRRRFRPTFWATFCAVPALIILLGLGTWQVQRLHWKEGEIAKREERSQGPGIPLPGAFPDPAAVEFTRVALAGSFLHDQEFYLGARTEKGRVGFNVVTPFRLDDGRILLMNRGWVPENRRDPATRAEGQLAGPLEVEALLRTDGWKGVDFAKPPNKPEERFYFWLDLPVMAEGVSAGPIITEIYADAVFSEMPGGMPFGGQTRIALKNDHLEYAITWYSFALILAVIYFLFHYRPEEEGPDDAA